MELAPSMSTTNKNIVVIQEVLHISSVLLYLQPTWSRLAGKSDLVLHLLRPRSAFIWTWSLQLKTNVNPRTNTITTFRCILDMDKRTSATTAITELEIYRICSLSKIRAYNYWSKINAVEMNKLLKLCLLEQTKS